MVVQETFVSCKYEQEVIIITLKEKIASLVRRDGSGCFRDGVLRFGSLPVDEARADAIRQQFGLPEDLSCTHFDSVIAMLWTAAEKGQKDAIVILRDLMGESPSNVARQPAPIAAGTLQTGDLAALTDSELRELISGLKSRAG